MRRNILVATLAIAVLGLIGWAVMQPSKPPPVHVSTAEKVVPGKTVEKSRSSKGKQNGGGRAVAVEAATARGAVTTADIRSIGSLRSDESVQIASEIAGRVSEINFAEGGIVEAGDILVKLDDALARAEVADAKARYDLADANNDRAKQLSRTGNVTRSHAPRSSCSA
jgi:membrane fusion protein (multidrug efflux system)